MIERPEDGGEHGGRGVAAVAHRSKDLKEGRDTVSGWLQRRKLLFWLRLYCRLPQYSVAPMMCGSQQLLRRLRTVNTYQLGTLCLGDES